MLPPPAKDRRVARSCQPKQCSTKKLGDQNQTDSQHAVSAHSETNRRHLHVKLARTFSNQGLCQTIGLVTARLVLVVSILMLGMLESAACVEP
jgi:hypothetical protein